MLEKKELESLPLWAREDIIIDDDSINESVSFNEFSMTSYGADFDVAGLVRRLNDEDIEIPEFQRRFVWTQERASRFIESLLLGLPVPGIFLYREDDSEKLQVIDGQQRLRTLQTFYSGKGEFGNNGERNFNLQCISSKFAGKSYPDLEVKYRRKLDNSLIHATIIHQEAPENDASSKYFVFERLNTESSPLSAQEIRAAIYQGPLNDLIFDLNRNHSAWRTLYGDKTEPDKRKRDEELILRFLSLFFIGTDKYKPPMKSFLNAYMSRNRCLEMQDAESIRSTFVPTVENILNKIGKKAFMPSGRINAAVTDSIMVGVANRLQRGEIVGSLCEPYAALVGNSEFMASASKGTSQKQNVQNRIGRAIEAFVDAS